MRPRPDRNARRSPASLPVITPSKQIEVLSYLLGEFRVVGCVQPQAAPTRPFLFQPRQQFLVVKKRRRIESRARSDTRLQALVAVTKQPIGGEKEIERVSLHERQKGLEQQVTANQRSFEIDTQRRR